MVLARSPWSGNYQVREALWGYAHYGSSQKQDGNTSMEDKPNSLVAAVLLV
jgi:hypothetical protein